jgi:hypothetical protein
VGGILKRVLLAATVLISGLLLIEGWMRFETHRRNQQTLQAALGQLSKPSDAPNAGMANIIRLSINDRIMYELQPGLHDRTFRNTRVSTDADGFRIAGEPRAVADDDITIVGIGDSVMFGHGVEGQEAYLARLQESLDQDEQQTGTWWRVVNAAVPGYNTVMEVETLRTKCLRLEPDLVILHIVGNDYAPPYFVRRQEDVFTADRSFLWEALQERTSDRTQARRQTAYLRGEWWLRRDREGNPLVPEDSRGLFGREAFVAALEDLIALSEEHGFDLIVFTNNELGKEPAMVREAVARGVEHVSLTEDLRGWLRENGGRPLDGQTYHDSPLVVGPDNGHPSALQHSLAAGRIAR